MGYNKIEKFDSLNTLKGLKHLQVVYFEHNPIGSEWDYRIQIQKLLPQIVQLDATQVRRS